MSRIFDDEFSMDKIQLGDGWTRVEGPSGVMLRGPYGRGIFIPRAALVPPTGVSQWPLIKKLVERER